MRLLLFLAIFLALPARCDDLLRVAVAANFRATLEQLNQEFTAAGDIEIAISSASTGVLATQLLHGAPFDLFFAADAQHPGELQARGIGVEHFCYARGALALLGSDTLDALNNPDLSLAIANPQTAPYGRAAVDVLEREMFAAGRGRKLVRGNSVLQAYQFWYSGAVDLALVARSMAPGEHLVVPPDWYRPLDQHLLVLNESPAVTAYLGWFGSDRVRTQILKAGYNPCP